MRAVYIIPATLGLAGVAVLLVPARYRLAIWTTAIAGCVVPWWNLQDHPHLQNVGWIPLVSPPVRPFDMLANLALYVPFGIFASARRGRGPGRVAGWALALSLLTEATQVFSHGRYPSMTDVTMNTAGAWVGALWRAYVMTPRRTA
jgi:VanZ family protein